MAVIRGYLRQEFPDLGFTDLGQLVHRPEDLPRNAPGCRAWSRRALKIPRWLRRMVYLGHPQGLHGLGHQQEGVQVRQDAPGPDDVKVALVELSVAAPSGCSPPARPC
jgi:predicted nuclease with RNAse H fold